MDEIKAFVNAANSAAIVCPSCGSRKTVAVEKFKGVKHTIKVKCPCGHQFSVHLDFRRHYRKSAELEGHYLKKNVNLEGFYINLSHGDEWKDDDFSSTINCTIKNISMGGVGIVPIGYSGIKEEDELRIKFTLDNKGQSEIDREVLVVSVTPYLVGCQFTESIVDDKNLGFYLMP